jgi:hypothetical protein
VTHDVGQQFLRDPEERSGPIRIEIPRREILAQLRLAGETGPRFELARLPLQRRNQAQIIEDAWSQEEATLRTN